MEFVCQDTTTVPMQLLAHPVGKAPAWRRAASTPTQQAPAWWHADLREDPDRQDHHPGGGEL